MQRRRLSRLSKMAVRVAFDAIDGITMPLPSVFASRHGEINRTIALLDNLVLQEPVSPTVFAQSVHNTASGMFSILSHNHCPSSAICAGSSSLPQAFIEGWSLSMSFCSPVLVVYVDEPIVEYYQPYLDEQESTLALAWVIEATEQGQCACQWHYQALGSDDELARPYSIARQWLNQSLEKRSEIRCQHTEGWWEWHA